MRALGISLVAALVLASMLGPGAAQPAPAPPTPAPPAEAGLREAWTRALREPLVALPLERSADAAAALGRLDALAQAFADAQRMLGDQGSGPLLRSMAPDALGVQGVGDRADDVAAFLAVAAAFRAGTLDEATHRLASGHLAATGQVLDRLRAPAARQEASKAAWEAAYAWYLPMADMADPNATASPSRASVHLRGNATPGGAADILVRDAPGNATLQTPWGGLQVGAGSSTARVPIPAGQAPGRYLANLTSNGTTVATVAIDIVPPPLSLVVSGPRQASPSSAATYTIAMVSPVAIDRPGRFTATAAGQPLAVVGDTFRLVIPASGEVPVEVRGGPGPPWRNATATFTVTVLAAVAPTTSGGPGGTAVLLVVAPAAALLALAVALRLRAASKPQPQSAAAAAALAEPAPWRPPGWSVATRLKAWWGRPEAVVAADYRRAARILAESGRLPEGATHGAVAQALEAEGLRPHVARRLAWAYEQVQYAREGEAAAPEYWKARREP